MCTISYSQPGATPPLQQLSAMMLRQLFPAHTLKQGPVYWYRDGYGELFCGSSAGLCNTDIEVALFLHQSYQNFFYCFYSIREVPDIRPAVYRI
jgi:hypothetical protein